MKPKWSAGKETRVLEAQLREPSSDTVVLEISATRSPAGLRKLDAAAPGACWMSPGKSLSSASWSKTGCKRRNRSDRPPVSRCGRAGLGHSGNRQQG